MVLIFWYTTFQNKEQKWIFETHNGSKQNYTSNQKNITPSSMKWRTTARNQQKDS